MEVHIEFRERKLRRRARAQMTSRMSVKTKLLKVHFFSFIIKLSNHSLETYATFQVYERSRNKCFRNFPSSKVILLSLYPGKIEVFGARLPCVFPVIKSIVL